MSKAILLGASLTIGASLLISACGQSPIGKAEDEFVGGCEQGGAPHAACTCVFDKMVDQYGKDKVLAAAGSNWNDVPPDFGTKMAHAVLQCRQS